MLKMMLKMKYFGGKEHFPEKRELHDLRWKEKEHLVELNIPTGRNNSK